MGRPFVLALVVIRAFLFGVSTSHAQSALVDLPRDSQHATVMQRIGITDITINYHRPLVKGRQIWGKVVPYGEIWRAGANENTTITFTDPVTIEGRPLSRYGPGCGLHWSGQPPPATALLRDRDGAPGRQPAGAYANDGT